MLFYNLSTDILYMNRANKYAGTVCGQSGS